MSAPTRYEQRMNGRFDGVDRTAAAEADDAISMSLIDCQRQFGHRARRHMLLRILEDKDAPIAEWIRDALEKRGRAERTTGDDNYA